MENKKTLIIQPLCPDYRIPFFKALADQLGKITILHFGETEKFNNDLNITEVRGEVVSLGTIKYVKKLSKHVRSFDIVIAMFDPHWVNIFTLPILYPEKKIVFWGHGLGKSRLFNILRVYLVKKTSALITYNKIGKAAFVKRGVFKNKIFIADNTVKVLNSQSTSEFDKKSFLYVGRLQRRKKIEVLLEGFFKLKLYKNGIVINIVGDGDEERAFLKEKVKNLQLEDYVNFIDGTTDEDVLFDFFSKAYAYVSPGAVGLGVLHSFAYGVPVITMKDENHGPEVINISNGQTGYICEDFASFCTSLKLITEHDFHKEMGVKAYRYFNEKRQIQHMVDSFKQVVDYI